LAQQRAHASRSIYHHVTDILGNLHDDKDADYIKTRHGDTSTTITTTTTTAGGGGGDYSYISYKTVEQTTHICDQRLGAFFGGSSSTLRQRSRGSDLPDSYRSPDEHEHPLVLKAVSRVVQLKVEDAREKAAVMMACSRALPQMLLLEVASTHDPLRQWKV